MAIRTISGDKIEKVISAEKDNQGQWFLTCKMSHPDESGTIVRECNIVNLLADGGIEEIAQAIWKCKNNTQTR